MRCPLCQRDIGPTVADEITHRRIGSNPEARQEQRYLCGYTSKPFLLLDALPSTILSSTIRRLWRVLDEHIKAEDTPVEVRTEHGWCDVEDVIEKGLSEDS